MSDQRPESVDLLGARLAAIIASSDDAIVSKNLQGIVQTWNDAAQRIFGYTAEEMIGQSITRLIPPERQDEEPQILLRLVKGERVDHFETVRVRKDGRRIDVSVTISPIRDRTGTIVGASKIARDITELKRVRAEREQLLESEHAARREAERISRMKDEFLATLSHELRTPLNSILGWAQLLRGGATTSQDLSQGLESIERNARLQAQLIDDLLDVSRIISGKVRLDVRRVELANVVADAVESMRPAADAKGVKLHCVLDPDAGIITGDPNRLQQIVWNLVSNAIKFTPRGGRVAVLLRRSGSSVEIVVEDTGQGIKSEFIPHLFLRFSQFDSSSTRRHGGLGLGLAIVKHLVELHGGTVRASSAGEGRGSTFVVSLPIAAVRPIEPDNERDAGSAAFGAALGFNLGGVRVAVVDDEPDARQLIRRILELHGAEVVQAESAGEGVEVVRGRRPHVVLSDIGMPGEDGYQFLRRLRELPPEQGGDTPVVALTAYARSEDRRRALLAGFQMHMTKPVEPAELLAVVTNLSKKRSSALAGK
jgi:PAS domain S-box-containing protein